MIEIQYTCEMCKQPFMRVATTEIDMKVLQETIWKIHVCERCSYQDCYWDE